MRTFSLPVWFVAERCRRGLQLWIAIHRAGAPCFRWTPPRSGGAATPGKPCSSDGQRNPHPEEPEAPLVVPGIPHGLLHVAEVVDRRRRSAPRWRQHPVPRRTRRRAPAPRRQAVSPWGAVEPPAPIVVLRTPRRPPIVAGTTTIAEFTGPTRTTGATASGPTRTRTTGHIPARPTRVTGAMASGPTRAGASGPIRTALHPRRAHGWFRVGGTRRETDGRRADCTAHDCSN